MLYPPLEEGHEVLGKDYCPGYTDNFGTWNNGFYCPPIIPDSPVFCCGTLLLKYCCSPGRPAVPGMHFPKGHHQSSSSSDADGELNLNEDEDDEYHFIGEEILPDVPIHADDQSDLNQKSLVIGIVCGLAAMAVVMIIAACFYCSCCVLYKKRRGHQLSAGLLYGIPVSSSSTTTCGLLNPLSGSTAAVTSSNENTGNAAACPNFIASPLSPLVDYWNGAGGSSGSSSACAGSTVIVAATATSLSPSGVGVIDEQSQHIHSGSVFHHHHHCTTTSGPPRPQPLEPPPSYLAVTQQQSGTLQGNRASLITSTRSSGVGVTIAGNNTNLLAQRQQQQSRHQNHNNSSNYRSAVPPTHPSQTECYSPTRRTPSLFPAANSGANTNLNITRSLPRENVSGNSATSNNSRSSNSNTSDRNGNALSRLLSSASASSGRGSSGRNLPPPYFIEQYRIRNRVRPPPFPSGTSTVCSTGRPCRRQDALQSLLYPLLNSAAVTCQQEHERRVAGDTQSEPRRASHCRNHRHHTSSNRSGGGSSLYRSQSDRHQGGAELEFLNNLSEDTSSGRRRQNSESTVVSNWADKILNITQTTSPREDVCGETSSSAFRTYSAQPQDCMQIDSSRVRDRSRDGSIGRLRNSSERGAVSIGISENSPDIEVTDDEDDDEVIAVVTTGDLDSEGQLVLLDGVSLEEEGNDDNDKEASGADPSGSEFSPNCVLLKHNRDQSLEESGRSTTGDICGKSSCVVEMDKES